MRRVKNDPATLLGRLMEKSIPEPNTGCWLWMGAAYRSDHGKIGIRLAAGKPKTVAAHRLIYEITHGPVPAGHVVMHRCDVPACINPDHLCVGTQKDNLQDMWRKGRARPGVVPPHKRGNAKLSWENVAQIRASSLSTKELARQLGVSDVLVGRVRNNHGWKEPQQ